jgi:hypothetical protein
MLSKFQNIWMRSYSEMSQTQVYHWVVAVFLAKSLKHPFLNKISFGHNLFNPLQTVGVDS